MAQNRRSIKDVVDDALVPTEDAELARHLCVDQCNVQDIDIEGLET